MKTLFNDCRYGIRKMLKNPGFTAIALITLALGIGANTAIFSIVYSVLLKSLPYKEPDKVVSINKIASEGDLPGIAAYEYLDWKEQNTSFEQIAAFSSDNFNLTGIGEPARIPCAQVTANTFPLLGIQPLKGRVFTADEDKPGSNQVVVVSEKFWERTFGNDKALSRQSITLNDKSYTVVGIMSNGFRFPGEYEIWMPLAIDEAKERHGDFWSLVEIVGRLKHGVTVEQARAELDVIAKRTAEASTEKLPPSNVEVIPLHKQLVSDFYVTILVLFGVVGFVLLIACVNVANLMLARAANRQREIGTRIAIGANRWQLFRQLLTESTLLGLIGGGLGILLAVWGIGAIVSIIPSELANSLHGLKDVSINKQVLLFTLGASILSGIIFGLAPALIASKTDVNRALNDSSAGNSSGFGLQSLRGWLVVIELALAFVLLIGAGLMVRSFNQKLEIKPGFNVENVLTMRVELPSSRYSEPTKKAEFYQSVLERSATLPGVKYIGAISHTPLSEFSMIAFFQIENVPPPDHKKDIPVSIGVVTPDYFRAAGIPLQNGRFLNEGDDSKATNVTLVNAAFVRRYFPNENPIGKRIGFGCKEEEGLCRAIVGVVGDIKQESLIADVVPEIYLSYKQMPMGGMTLFVKTANEPLSMAGIIREQISIQDKDQPVYAVKTLEQILKESVAQTRAIMLLLTVFAGLALLLASVGIYGVMSYAVTQRRREIGIRIALGADRINILSFIMKQGLLIALGGVGIGLIAAVFLTRLMQTLLFGITATDTFTFISIAFLLMTVALLACYIPARRATKVDPINALRHE